MAVNTLTLYMPGSSVGIQVYEGSQLHLILVSQGANSIPSAPGQTVRQDPFPQYVDDEELAAALAGVGGGGGAVASVNGQTGAVVLDAADLVDFDTASVAAVEAEPTVNPAGAWDFDQAPTVAGAPIGGGTGTVSDATTTTKGVVQLAGHLGGTAAAPTVRAATTTGTGIVELATAAETTTGTDTTRAVTPAGLKVELDKKVANGGGLSAARVMTQAAYDALGTKDAATLYVIVG